MDKQTEESLLEVLVDIRNWIRIASHDPIKKLLEASLPDAKSRAAYQMLDGTVTNEQVRAACKMSPNTLVAATNRWTALGLMTVTQDKRRMRLFDLNTFGLLNETDVGKPGDK